MPDKISFLADVLSSVPTGLLVLDTEGKVLMMNHLQEEISKVNREKVIGRYFHDV